MQLIAMDHAEEALSPSEAVVLILQSLREKPDDQEIGLLRFERVKKEGAMLFRKSLKGLLRKDDQLLALQSGVVIALVKCPLDNLPLVSKRLLPHLQQLTHSAGSIAMWCPEIETQAIFEWIQKGANRSPQAGWEVYPERWETEASGSAQSPSVDPLTGVLKSERVSRALRRMLAVQRRVGQPATLIRLDIDQLDSYNNAHGKEAGDQVLKHAARLLMDNCRETDLIGRLQEDEFVIAMQGDAPSILEAVQRMSDLIKKTMLSVGEEQVRFSLGSGLASMPKDGRNPMQLLQKAGWAMDEAKKRGRGVCVAYQPGLEPSSVATATNSETIESF